MTWLSVTAGPGLRAGASGLLAFELAGTQVRTPWPDSHPDRDAPESRRESEQVHPGALDGEPAPLVFGMAAEKIVFGQALRDAVLDDPRAQRVADVRRVVRVETLLQLQERAPIDISDLDGLGLRSVEQRVDREPAARQRFRREALVEFPLLDVAIEDAVLTHGPPALAVQPEQRVERRTQLVTSRHLAHLDAGLRQDLLRVAPDLLATVGRHACEERLVIRGQCHRREVPGAAADAEPSSAERPDHRLVCARPGFEVGDPEQVPFRPQCAHCTDDHLADAVFVRRAREPGLVLGAGVDVADHSQHAVRQYVQQPIVGDIERRDAEQLAVESRVRR